MSNEDYIECYNRIAYDDLQKPFESNRYKNRYLPLKSFIGDVKGKRVLDVGCGDGAFLSLLKNCEKIGVDIAEAYIKIAKRRGLNVFFHDIELPFDQHMGKFDIIIISDVLEHVLNPQRVLENIKKVLKRDGLIYVVIPWKEDLSYYKQYEGIYRYTHLRSFDEKSVVNMFKDFYILKSKGIVPKIPQKGIKRYIFMLCDKMLPVKLRDVILIRLFRADFAHLMLKLKFKNKGI